MIQIRESYQLKFGKIDQAVEHFMRYPGVHPGAGSYEVLTDLSGEMYTLVAARHVESLRVWEEIQATSAKGKDVQEWFRPFKQVVEDGHREFNHVEQDNGGWSGRGAIVVRSCFRALEWRLAETVELLKTYGAMLVDTGVGTRPRILTDASGWMFNTFIEIETPDLRTWDDSRRNLFDDPQFQVWFLRLTGCVSGGSHRFYTVAGQTDGAGG